MLVRVHGDNPSPRSQSHYNGTLENMTITYFSELALFVQSIQMLEDDGSKADTVTVTFSPPGNGETKSIQIPLMPVLSNLGVVDLSLHRSPTKAYNIGEPYNSWFSSCFGYSVMLVYLGPHLRPVLGNLSPGTVDHKIVNNSWFASITASVSSLTNSKTEDDEGITFADVAPYLVVTEESVNDVSDRLSADARMDVTKFRPNIVLSGSAAAYDEDFWGGLKITCTNDRTQEAADSIQLILTQNCARCKSINIDYSTGAQGVDEFGSVLKKLMNDRRVDSGTKYSPIFGRYGFLESKESSGSTIAVGDDVVVCRRNEERTKFGKLFRGGEQMLWYILTAKQDGLVSVTEFGNDAA